MTSFRDYREALEAGDAPEREMPALPSDAVAFQGDRAGFVSRAVAAGIDVALVFLTVLGTIAVIWMLSFVIDPTARATGTSVTENRVPGLVVMIMYGYALNWAYWTIAWATTGRTIGNLVMGLRVVSRTGEHPRWLGAAVRSAFCAFFPFGLLWVIVSRSNRSVQDVVLRTNVIYDWVIGIPGMGRRQSMVAEASTRGSSAD